MTNSNASAISQCRTLKSPLSMLWHNKTVLALALLFSSSTAQDSQVKSTKRGIAYLGDTHRSDNALLLSPNSPLSWYYNWSPYPAARQIPLDGPMEFTPLIHGVDDASNSRTIAAINSLPRSSTHLLTFNEPDGSVESGGSNISPEDAARSYIDSIVPLRTQSGGDRDWLISHPSVTGSAPGLDWLRRFNASCYEIDSANGCPTDFVAAHWYGNFIGLASWLGQLDEFYNANRTDQAPLKIWITEMGLPQASAEATVQMMNQTLPYLENLTYVEKYAWFGAFRTDDANEWTGDGVALFDRDGGLTQLGSVYMGGPSNGFEVGDKGEQSNASTWRIQGGMSTLRWWCCGWTLIAVMLVMVSV